jgi:drug/metabolite transporter (DMT)-like permease
MSLINYGWALFIATSFVLWPIIGKSTGASGQWVNNVVLIGCTLVSVSLAMPGMSQQPLPSLKAFLLLGIAACINGFGFFMYSMKTTDPTIQTGTFMCLVTILMVIIGFAASWMFTDQAVTVRQGIGLIMAIIAIGLITG